LHPSRSFIFSRYSGGLGVPATFIERANEVNLEMAKYVVDRVKADNGGSLKGKKVQVVGVAYKPNVADVRETPAEPVIEELKKAGAVVTWSDDLVSQLGWVKLNAIRWF
jgi:UDP-N-acetyl-D-glucosamine dehydrogenase